MRSIVGDFFYKIIIKRGSKIFFWKIFPQMLTKFGKYYIIKIGEYGLREKRRA